MSVLIVEDDDAVRRAHAKILERAGLEVVAVQDAITAFEQLSDREFAAILCDINMPTLTGSSFFEQLEERFPQAAGRVVFVTGLAEDPDTREFLEGTGQPFFGKPAEPEALIAAVKDAPLGPRPRRGGRRRLATPPRG